MSSQRYVMRPLKPHWWPKFDWLGSLDDPHSWVSLVRRERLAREARQARERAEREDVSDG